MLDEKYVFHQLITYIGNKRKLLGFIGETVEPLANSIKNPIIFDGFAGSGVVSRFMRRYATKVIVNDMETYSSVIASCYMSNKSQIDENAIKTAILDLNDHRFTTRGIIAENYAPVDDDDIKNGERCFYTSRNATIIDSIRARIDNYPDAIKPYLFAPLLYRASVNVNTSGVFKGFYKDKNTGIGKFGGTAGNALARIKQEIYLEAPVFSDFECEYEVLNANINDIVADVECDIAYYDPPYNQHPYGSNYFMLNTILENKVANEVSKVSGIPVGWNKSDYNHKHSADAAFRNLLKNSKAKYVLVAYNDGGILSLEELNSIFSDYGDVEMKQKAYPRFKGGRPTENNKQPAVMLETMFLIKMK